VSVVLKEYFAGYIPAPTVPAGKPPVREVPVQAKLLTVFPSVMLGVPAVSAVRSTWDVLVPSCTALTPTAGNELLQAVIAAARFDAKVEVLLLIINCPVVVIEHVFVTVWVSGPGLGLKVMWVLVLVKVMDPLVMLITVTTVVPVVSARTSGSLPVGAGQPPLLKQLPPMADLRAVAAVVVVGEAPRFMQRSLELQEPWPVLASNWYTVLPIWIVSPAAGTVLIVTVPVVPFIVRVSVFDGLVLVMVTVWVRVGVVVPEKVPVWVAAAPAKFMLQSRFRGSPRVGLGGLRMGHRSETGALNRVASVAKSGAVANARCAGFRFICCIM
jgi:hypothetical protein